MNRLRQEIRSALSELKKETSGELSARCLLPARFIGFQGHFPDRPVLPGVCLAQVVIEAYNVLHRPARLLEIVKADFLHPVTPGETFALLISMVPDEDGALLLHGRICIGEKKIANLKMRIKHED